ncbi:serine/threonine-protein kinase [Tahibacter harae]|uniref:Serine/threonine-protein kinase n=1 Tax=Tahibacter harae TaxID=2963937 RepID=A0ABT1QX09_9GAMM|nr:serine/threonine-protein kinase [Tahibacter harae]MCQ4166816.1 serine/threonine-protein kinase [Tahibacter harae]
MDERTRRALAVVRELLDLAPVQRAAHLAAACGDDAALRREVETLFAQAAAIESSLEAPDGEDAGNDAAADSDALIGSRLGAYHILERLGRGGMGVVYKAERREADFRQRVAIKLIRRGHDFDEVQARFLRERRILARLSHPNLARFIDGGIAPDGRPWFALEYVQGRSLTAWCDARRLDLHARIALLQDVCAAVEYAHSQLVVHRDLKPGNILVDDQGQVRLLDFGIAGLLQGDGDDTCLTGAGGRRALTPQYAAPEQFGDEPAGVAADVYSLGMIGYELVTGVLPYAVPRHDAVAAGRIAGNAPFLPPASAIARTTQETPRDTAQAERAARLAARATSARAFRRQVRGDLSRILARALEKEPARRYSSVQRLADDLAAWRQGRAIAAHPGARGYRLYMFLRRNRVAVALAAVAALALLAGMAAVVVQARRVEEASRRGAAVQDFLTGLFENAVPGAAADQVPDTRELLARGAGRARSELAAQPLLQADLLRVLGRIHVQLALHDEAEPLLRDAIRLYEQAGATENGALADSVYELAYLQRRRNRYEEAQTLLQRGLSLNAGRDLALEARLRNLLGVVLAQRKRVDEGVAELQQALRLRRQLEQPPGKEVAISLNDLGTTLGGAGRAAEALPYLREAVALNRQLFGPAHVNLSNSLSNLGEPLRSLGRLDEAEAALRESVAIDAKVYRQPNSAQARHLANLALIALVRGDGAAAEAPLREALRLRQAIYREDDPQIAQIRTNLATALGLQLRYAEAADMAAQAIAAFDQAAGDWRGVTAAALQTRAVALRQLARADEAIADGRRALALLQAARGEDSAETQRARGALGKSLLLAGRRGEAAPLLRTALARSRALLPAAHPDLIEREANVAALEMANGDDAAARAHFEAALAIAVEGAAPGLPALLEARLGLAELLARQGEKEASHALAERIREPMQQRPAGDALRKRWEALPGAKHES